MGRLTIVLTSIFISEQGVLGGLKNVFIGLCAVTMSYTHYNYLPFKNSQTQKVSGGLLLWYCSHCMVHYLYVDLDIIKKNFLVDCSLLQLFLATGCIKYYICLLYTSPSPRD